jgi:hypothetical protein
MAIEKITNELDALNIESNSGDTSTRITKATIKYSIADGDADVLTTILEKIISKLDEITDKIN